MNHNNLPTHIHLQGVHATQDVFVNGRRITASASLAHRNHSPDGFAWGYGGSGPAQLALAVLLRFMPAKNALTYYQRFKSNVIAALPQSDFETEINLREVIQKMDG